MHDTYTYTYMMSSVCANSYNAILIWTTVYAHIYIHLLIRRVDVKHITSSGRKTHYVEWT